MNSIHYYDVNLKWEKERLGKLTSSVLPTAINVATPPEFPKGMTGIWSPEHLLVAAVNSCLMTTFLAIAENSKLEFNNFECDAIGKMDKVDGKLAITEITLKPVVTILKADDKERAERIIIKSEEACLISNSIKSKIHLQFEIRIGESINKAS